ncbi:MAG TPA: glycosyltransferase family 4 protein [Candidatus Angelobacter sp.]|nr:glycosyltransferase family 4 protein [Candidatus Angelobacter sp.]
MKIVVLTSFPESLINVRLPLLKTLVAAGHSVLACAPDAHPGVPVGMKQIGVRFHAMPLKRTGLNPLADFRFLRFFTRFLKAERPDLMFSYTIKSVIYGSLAAHRAGVPRLFALMTGLGYAFTEGNLKQRLVGRVARALYRRALPHNDAVFFQNPDDLQLFLSLGLLRDAHRAVRVNGSGVDLERFAFQPPPSGPPVFLLVARLLRDKGIVEYAEAARLLKPRHPEARFQLVGPHDANPSAISRQELGAWRSEGIIEYPGATDDVRPFLAGAGVFVLPSYREGTPMSVLEAMAVGRPIVTTDVPGCRETVVPGENGFLVPARDATALASAMERFIVEPDLIAKMGRRSREIAVEKFDVRKVNAVILKTMGL